MLDTQTHALRFLWGYLHATRQCKTIRCDISNLGSAGVGSCIRAEESPLGCVRYDSSFVCQWTGNGMERNGWESKGMERGGLNTDLCNRARKKVTE